MVEYTGTTGNDVLYGENDTGDYISGGNGNDTLYGGGGNDTLDGGAGYDFMFAGDGNDLILYDDYDENAGVTQMVQGGAGSDTLDGSAVDHGFSFSIFHSQDDKYYVYTGMENLVGSHYSDTLEGSSLGNMIKGGFGDDSMSGLEGDDTMDGGYGRDTIDAGAGNDIVYFDEFDRPDDVTLKAAVRGGAGSDTLVAQEDGYGKTISLWYYPEFENVIGTSLKDYIIGANDHNILVGGQGNDIIRGLAGKDTIYGGEGADLLDGGTDADVLYGGSGNDTLVYDKADLLIDGNDGYDVLVLSELAGRVDIALQGNRKMKGIEEIIGGNGDNYLTGDNTDNVFYGAGGKDTLNGAGGNDELHGGIGNDSYLFGAGYGNDTMYDNANKESITDWNDMLILSSAFSSDSGMVQVGDHVKITLTANDNLTVAGWFDMTADQRFERVKMKGVEYTVDTGAVISKSNNKNFFMGNDEDNVVSGLGLGNNADIAFGLGGNDLLVGGKGSDSLYGDAGSDTLYGNEDNDLLVGDSGDDLLDGGGGSDTLIGGEGRDSLYGGAGADWMIADAMDIADGGNDVDMLDVRSDMAGMTVSLNHNDASDQWRNFENFLGGSGADFVTAAAGANRIETGAGADTIDGGGGRDTVLAGGGDDVVAYYDGISLVDGGLGIDIVNAQHGSKGLSMNVATDKKYKNFEGVIGTSLGDTITGGKENNGFDGGAGNDILDGGAGNDELFGENGNDTYVFGLSRGNDAIGETGNDACDKLIVTSGFGVNIDISRRGEDLLIALNSNDNLTLLDWFEDEGPMIEKVQIGTKATNIYNIGVNADSIAVATGKNFFIGTDAEDVMTGAGLGNDADIAFGLDGNDVLIGGNGIDMLFGGTGNDWLMGGNDADTLVGGAGDDTLLGGNGADRLLGGDGNDILIYDGADPFIDGGQGFDVLTAESFVVGTTIDLTKAKCKNIEQLVGSNYGDTLKAASIATMIYGGIGNDVITGGAGNDSLSGDAGNDLLAGGAGSDTYFFGLGAGNDIVIASTSNSIDSICFADGLTTEDLVGTTVGNDLLVSIAATGETLTMAGWNSSIGNKLNQFIIGNETYQWNGSAWKAASVLRGVLAYVSDRGGNDNIYSTQSNDSHAIALTTSADGEWSPVWSPDGSHMAYVLGSWNSFVYVMNDDGTGKTDLTPNYGDSNVEPVWSPGGYKMLFNHQGSWSSDLYLLTTDGTGYGQNLTNTPSAYEYDASWSPDGTKIAYGAWDGYLYSIFTLDLLSGQTNKLELSGGNDNYGYLSWSPDGSKLACVDTGSNQIIVVNADGSGEQQLTVPGTNEVNRNPVWSPDGTKLAYEWGIKNPSTLVVTNWEIMMMNVDGSGKTQLTINSADDCKPVWSPDGTQLAFETLRNGNWDIYYMDSDGTNQTRVTFSEASDTNPVWQPQSSFSAIKIVEGTSGADASLVGGEGNDIIYGFEGADIIDGLGGNDTIFGGIGDDTVDGGNGNDLLFSGGSYLNGGEILQGGNGNDTLIVEANCSGSFNLVGGAGSDIYQVTLHELYGVPVIAAAADNSADTLVITQASTARIWIEQSGNDLYLTNSNYSSNMYLKDWYRGGGYQLQNFRFGDALYGIADGEWALTQVLVGNDDGHNTKATALSIASGSDITDGLNFAGDSDWFTYTPTENGTYNLYLSAGNTPLFIDILDVNGQQINDWRNEPNSLQDGFVANAKMEVGHSYYIRIVGQDPLQAGDYNIQFVKQTPTAGDDKLHGSTGNDYIDALGGNDTIVHWYGSMFDDGRDTLLGGDGNDIIIMGGNYLYVDGGNDNDDVSGYMSSSTVYGGAGDDDLSGVYGSSNTIDGGNGNDNMGGDTSGCLYVGGAGNDTLGFWNSASYNTLRGGEGNDVYSIREGGYGGVNHNIINNFAENGATDMDVAQFSSEFRKNDFIYNAEAGDLVMYRYRNGSLQEFLRVTQWFAGNEYQVDSFVFNSYEDGGTLSASDIIARTGINTSGSMGEGNDLVYGNSMDNLLNALGGNDQIYGFDGNDTLSGGTGNDVLFDGAGNDVLAGGDGADTFVWSGAGNADVIEDYGLGDKLVLGAGITFEMLDDASRITGHEVYLSETALVFNLGDNNLSIKNWYQGEGTSSIVNFDDGSQHTLYGNTTAIWWG